MREIKFRAWYKDAMHFNVEKHHVEHHALSNMHGEVWDFADWIEYSKLMQYTGLKDKNDVEIYEGDIWISGVLSNKPIEIKFVNGKFNIADFEVNHWTTISEKGEASLSRSGC